MADSSDETGTREPEARERIVDSSYELFSRRGIQAVGVDEVIEKAGVAKATLYRTSLRRTTSCSRSSSAASSAGPRTSSRREPSRGSTPEEQLLAIFDVFDEWFRREDFEACSFINVLLEMGPEHPAGEGQHAPSREHPVRCP